MPVKKTKKTARKTDLGDTSDDEGGTADAGNLEHKVRNSFEEVDILEGIM